MKRNPSNKEGFVADGHNRARQAIEPSIRAVVEMEFTVRWNAASLWQRFWLQREINREVERRIAEVAPPEALYFCSSETTMQAHRK